MTPRGARILHTALVVAVIGLLVALALIRDAAGMEAVELPAGALRIAVFAMLIGALVGQRLLRAGVSPPSRGTDAGEWWQAHGPRILTIWALCDGLATAGAVFWFLTGDFVVLAIGTGVGLFLMVTARPAGFEGG